MRASHEGHVNVVQALLQHGANVNAATNDVRERERERETKR
jgi:ankyrin repeat protein